MKLPKKLIKRKLDSHKGDFGHILIIGGSRGMSGAATLVASAAASALRSGAGLVTVGLPKSILQIVASYMPEIMTLPLPETPLGSLSYSALSLIKRFLAKIDVLVVGPGLSRNPQTQRLVRKLVFETDKKMIVDADGLNALAGKLRGFRGSYQQIFTPHVGEFARLINQTPASIQKNRQHLASQFAERYKVVLVLKGYRTIVVGPNAKLYINHTGNSGMSTAGSGDVLCGIIAAFYAQGLDSFQAAKYAVYIHGLAGDLAAKEKTQLGLIASDIIHYLPKALKKSS